MFYNLYINSLYFYIDYIYIYMFLNIDVLEDTNNIPLNFNKPYILKNNKMTAIKKWNINYLKKQLNDTFVTVKYYKSIKNCQIESGIEIDTKFNEYMSDIENGRLGYLLELELKNMENVLDRNDTIERFKFRRPCESKQLYLGINTYSNSHIHLNNDVVLNQIFGKKIVYMYDYYDNPSLELVSIFNKCSNFIKDNFWELDLNKYKLYKVILEPGDCLLIPPLWYHAVKGIDLSYSIAFVYKRTDFNYMKMGDLKIRTLLFQNIIDIKVILLYIITSCILNNIFFTSSSMS